MVWLEVSGLETSPMDIQWSKYAIELTINFKPLNQGPRSYYNGKNHVGHDLLHVK